MVESMLTEKKIYVELQQLSEKSQIEVLNYIQFLIQQTRKSSSESKKRVFGSAQGKYQLSDDFDAPLDDFKDYVP